MRTILTIGLISLVLFGNYVSESIFPKVLGNAATINAQAERVAKSMVVVHFIWWL